MKHFLPLTLFLLFYSCFKDLDDNIAKTPETLSGLYTYTDPDCNKSDQFLEKDCNDYIEFLSKNTVSVILRKEDAVYVTDYSIENKIVTFKQVPVSKTKLSFKIKNDTTLMRLEDNTLWIKKS